MSDRVTIQSVHEWVLHGWRGPVGALTRHWHTGNIRHLGAKLRCVGYGEWEWVAFSPTGVPIGQGGPDESLRDMLADADKALEEWAAGKAVESSHG